MSGLLELIDVALKVGDIFKACDGSTCRSYRVRAVIVTRRGRVAKLTEVAGSLAVHPMVAFYDQLLRAGILPKVASERAWKKFGKSRRTFYRHLAAR